MRFWMHYIDIVKYQKVPRAYYRKCSKSKTSSINEISSICNDFEDIQDLNSSCT